MSGAAELERLTKGFVDAAVALHGRTPSAFPLMLESKIDDGDGGWLIIRAKFSRSRSQKGLYSADALARAEVERSLASDGIIEDPDMDGGLLG